MLKWTAIGAIALGIIVAAPALAQVTVGCGETRTLMATLAGLQQHARIVGIDMANGGIVVQFYVNTQTGDWTYVVSNPQTGQSCVPASGTTAIILDEPPSVEGSPV